MPLHNSDCGMLYHSVQLGVQQVRNLSSKLKGTQSVVSALVSILQHIFLVTADCSKDAVKETFKFAWDGYRKYCFGEDELLPVTNTCGHSRNGWGATAIDALSTALVMQIEPVVDDILDFIPTVDFTRTEDTVSLFETTIRYLAGLLSAYDLLKGPLANLASNASVVEEILIQAKTLADTLKYAFDTPSGVPYNNLLLSDKTNDGATSNGLATTGTLVLEWQRLSDITGDHEVS